MTPFKAGCQVGCPCDSFDCEPDKKSILVLNTVNTAKPHLIKYDGDEDTSLSFTIGSNTSAYRSCAATLNGEMYVFGGAGVEFNKQVFYPQANIRYKSN